jgi:hypothetical protein
MTSLRGSLPEESLNYFAIRRAGKHYGMAITCPHCGDRPEHFIRPWNRWRWLTAHVVSMHSKPRHPFGLE